jgi:hypothetical protein
MKTLLLAGALAGALSIGTTTLCAQEHGQDNRSAENRTYTDSNHERHEWNANEDGAWKRYRGEHHIKQEDFAKANRRQQEAYWKWRHEHPDERR